MGRLITRSLAKLGYAEPVTIRITEVANLVTQNTGKTLTKQRLKAILKAENLSTETLEWLAKGLGVSVAELVSGNPGKPK